LNELDSGGCGIPSVGMETILLNSVFALSLMRRTLLAFASETVSKDMRTRAARRGYVFAAASISRKHMRLVARERVAPEMAYSDGDCSHTLHAALPRSPTDVPAL
jgi:hypothetical protein